MTNSSERKQLLLELQKSKDYVRQNWTDSVAKQYLIWVDRTEDELKKIERESESIRSKLNDMRTVCQKALDDDGEGEPKQLKKIRSL